MPSYGGFQIFGTAVTMTTAENPRSGQANAYFGLDGVEFLDGGARGRTTLVTGLLIGGTAESLASAEASFRTMADGLARTLVDTSGTPWPDVRLESFQPKGRILCSPTGSLLRPYQARFLHLA